MTACDLLFADICYPVSRDYTEWARGDLAIADGVVAEIGPELGYAARKRIVQPDLLVLPGLYNLHTHGHDLLWRGSRDDEGVDRHWPEWFWAAYDSIDLDAQLGAARVTYAANLLSGVTFVVDHLRSLLPGPPFRDVFESVGIKGRVHSHILGASGDPLVIPHETSRFFSNALDAAAKLDRRPIMIHAQETERRLEEAYRLYGRSTVEVLDDFGLLHDQTFLVHMGHHSMSDLDLISRRGAHIVVTPAAEMKLGEKHCDPLVAADRRVSFLIGTDGPAYQNGEDLFLDLKLLSLRTSQTHGPGRLAPGEILAMATWKAADAMGQPQSFPAPRSVADLTILDGRNIGMLPLVRAPFDNVAQQLIHGASRAAVRHVVVNGRLALEDGVAAKHDVGKSITCFLGHASRYFDLY